VGFGETRWAGWASLILLPFFSDIASSFLAAIFWDKTREGFGKICKKVIKLDFDLKQFFKVCKY
jgi:hypothetical protein